MTTHNPHRGRLERTLVGLCGQSLPTTQWEFVLVDNACTIRLDAHGLGLAGFANWCLVREQRLGTVFGRAAAVLNSRAPLVVLVDDDNVLAPDYLERTLAILDRLPNIGVGGGNNSPEWEGGPPPRWVEEFRGPLAVRDYGSREMIIKSDAQGCPEYRPYGAGMIARREAIVSWAEGIASKGSVLGQRGQQLLRGEDDDMVLHCFHSGWDVGYFPELQLTHIIPPERVTPRYLGRLLQGIGKSEILWRSAHGVNRYGAAAPWTIPLRKLKAYFRFRAWSGPAEYVRWKYFCGLFEGRAAVAGMRGGET
jgi:hypothetical protein